MATPVLPGKQSTSTIAIYIIALCYLISFFYYAKWNDSTLIAGDPAGYYVYLPAAFIYHDLNNLKTTEAAAGKYRPDLYSIHKITGGILLDNGNLINKYSMGMAILHLPFFLLACLLCLLLGYPLDGFSLPFPMSIHLGSIFYVISGFFFLRWVLKKYFTDNVVAIVLLIISLGTNLYCYAIYENVMAHSYLFSLYCTLLFFTIKWYESLETKFALLIGLCCGLITLIRPNEIICIFIPLLYGIHSLNSLRERLKFIQHHWKAFTLTIVMFIAAGVPQLIYWKILSGKFLFYSYGKEGFDFLHPHVLSGLFSFHNGWLIYSPLMIFAVAGLLLLPAKNNFKVPLLVYLPVYVYMIYSYWEWSYSNGFGSRPMVETYPLLAIPLGYFIHWIFQKRNLSALFSLCVMFFMLLNIFQMWQYSQGILLTSLANSNTYSYLFGRTSMTTKALIMYDINEPQPDNLSFERTVFTADFNNSLHQKHQSPLAGDFYAVKNKEDEFLSLGTLTNHDLVLQKGRYLKISLWARNDNCSGDIWRMTSIVNSIDHAGKTVFWKNVRVQNKSGIDHPGLWNCKVCEWNTIQYFLCIPDNFSDDFNLKFYLWDANKCNQNSIDDFSVEVWK